MTLAESVVAEIELLAACGFESRESLFHLIVETGSDELDPSTRALLRDAIEAAFERKEEDSRAWPSITDCDRVRSAFDALDGTGIVALEGCGFTQDEGLHQAALLSLARNELGHAASDGYCFFTQQDAMEAVAGNGLWLSFGTFKEGSTTHATEVGQEVVRACREAGLAVEWNGSPATRIRLPGFRWQRRVVTTRESEVRKFLESWELEVRAGYTPVEEIFDALEERACDWFAGCADLGPALLARLRAHTEKLLEDERAREATWSEATVNDRISAAFGDLRGRGVVALECSGLTIHDGWGYVGLEASGAHRGAVFFHHEDVIDAINGLGLLLAFGALGASGDQRDDAATIALGQEIVSVLEEHGVPCTWSGSSKDRIRIAPFEWRRRRWTKPPPYERKEPSKPSSARSRSLPNTADPPTPARALAVVVRAVRDERGFDLRRAKQMRAGWKTIGNSGDAQVAHLGLPHVFVRAGEYTTMMPQLATLNLREEKNEILERAARAKAASG